MFYNLMRCLSFCPTNYHHKGLVEGNLLTHYVFTRTLYLKLDYLLGYIYSKIITSTDPYRGDLLVITLSTTKEV